MNVHLYNFESNSFQLTCHFQLKKYRFNLQKAVNTPVNAIAPTNGAHLRDKLKRLVLLLAGDVVEVTGKRISAKEHPAGIQFVRDLFAEKLVVCSLFQGCNYSPKCNLMA